MQNNDTALFNRNFILVVIGQVVSILGSALLRFALSTYVLDLTGRADIFAALLAISTIPSIILSPIGGAIADRFNRRNLMILFDFTSSAVVLSFVFFLLAGNASVILIGIVMVLLGIISAMYQPAVQASIPVLTKEDNLEKANGIVNGVGALSNLAGPVLGGVLYSMVGIYVLVIVSCVAFFLSAIMEIFIKMPFSKREQNDHIVPTLFKDMKSGFIYVLKQPYILKAMILAAVLNLFLTPFFLVGTPYMMRVTLQSSDAMYGISLGIIQFSSILGALTIGIFAKKMKITNLYRWLILISILILPMALAVSPLIVRLGYFPSFILFFLCAIPIVMAMTIVSIFVITIVQKQTPNDLLGKVMAIITAVAQCAAPIGQILYGALFEAFSLSVYFPILIMFAMMLLISAAAKVMLRNEEVIA
ncbi:MFS transporter [Bacillus chungangensis]|uniref:MFS family permease n=1 Tax=Bacillus chungangensis TaxID=587633 RepID=A0ABT9WM76_9BACI|nr:MFS transporter [Bacillus chungangensis]MDQ0174258.1 MFS family permease [Bacillus chungangensis]